MNSHYHFGHFCLAVEGDTGNRKLSEEELGLDSSLDFPAQDGGDEWTKPRSGDLDPRSEWTHIEEGNERERREAVSFRGRSGGRRHSEGYRCAVKKLDLSSMHTTLRSTLTLL